MINSKMIHVLIASALAFVSACENKSDANTDHANHSANPVQGSNQIVMTVTSDGFVPADIKVKMGQPVKLTITRKVEQTCATDIVIKDYGIKKPLPLNQAVEVEFTPTKSGKIKYACAMNMIRGEIIVE